MGSYLVRIGNASTFALHAQLQYPMSTRTNLLPANVYSYVLRQTREPEVLAELRAATSKVPHNVMQIGADQGALMALLVRLIGAKRCIELGTYTGYSALAVALALPSDGKLIACDVSAEWTAVGQPFWRKGGVADRIDLRLGPGLETLDALLAAGEAGRFDFAFIDADKPNYPAYYERLLTLVRQGGLIAVDNTLALSGAPIIELDSIHARAMVAFNELVRKDERVDQTMLTVGEGLTLLRVR
jgi:predicted O-methyltransferase YrrM